MDEEVKMKRVIVRMKVEELKTLMSLVVEDSACH